MFFFLNQAHGEGVKQNKSMCLNFWAQATGHILVDGWKENFSTRFVASALGCKCWTMIDKAHESYFLQAVAIATHCSANIVMWTIRHIGDQQESTKVQWVLFFVVWGGGVSGFFVLLLLLFWLCGGVFCLFCFCFWRWVVVGLDFFDFVLGGGGECDWSTS